MDELRPLFEPSYYTTDIGTPVWFRYTHRQWMRGIVVRAGKKIVVLEPAEGMPNRRIRVTWAEVRWHDPRSFPAPTRALDDPIDVKDRFGRDRRIYPKP